MLVKVAFPPLEIRSSWIKAVIHRQGGAAVVAAFDANAVQLHSAFVLARMAAADRLADAEKIQPINNG